MHTTEIFSCPNQSLLLTRKQSYKFSNKESGGEAGGMVVGGGGGAEAGIDIKHPCFELTVYDAGTTEASMHYSTRLRGVPALHRGLS